MDKRKVCFDMIDKERKYQEQQFESGRWERMSQSPMEFLADIRVYSRKAEEAFVETGSDKEALRRICQIAALAVACLEKISTRFI